jgi:hypothetical protein
MSPLPALITSNQIGQLTHDFQSFLAWLSLIFGLVMALWSILMMVVRTELEKSFSGRAVMVFVDFLLPVIVMAVAIWIATITGAGVAGGIAIGYGLFFTIVTVGAAVLFKNSLVAAIGLTALSVLIATTLGGIDIYNAGHCLGNGTLC